MGVFLKKRTYYFGVFLLWFGSLGAGLPCRKPIETQRDKLIELANQQVGVRELTGNNDGEMVEMYLHSVNLKKGDPWCAAFLGWLFSGLGIDNPKSGWSPSWFPPDKVVYKNDWRKDFVALPGQVGGLYFKQKNRIAHVFLVEYQDEKNYYTIEGNTNIAGSREGDGVYRKIRSKQIVYAIADFISEDKQSYSDWRRCPLYNCN